MHHSYIFKYTYILLIEFRTWLSVPVCDFKLTGVNEINKISYFTTAEILHDFLYLILNKKLQCSKLWWMNSVYFTNVIKNKWGQVMELYYRRYSICPARFPSSSIPIIIYCPVSPSRSHFWVQSKPWTPTKTYAYLLFP